MDTKRILAQMTLEEKIAYCTGKDFWHTKEMPQYEVPSIKMSDGPHGLRCQEDAADMLGINNSIPATCFPAAVTAAATWNPVLYGKEGAAIGKEALAAEVSVVLGPGCNIKRNPLGGRNFEYLSEDPCLAGTMATAFIQGVQETGASACLKHFAANNQEYKRQNGDSRIDERTLREIYLAPFETAVKKGKPDTVMCAYNKINGTYCSDNKRLLTDILRSEWGFDGMVVTDWGAMNDRIHACQAGCDLNMPGGNSYMEKELAEAVRNGTLDEREIDACVERILNLVCAHGQDEKPEVDWEAHHALALEVARQGAVLLKNEDNILPLNTDDAALIGYMAEELRYQGSGSSHINPTRLVNLTDVWGDVPYAACCDKQGSVDENGLKRAAELAREKPVAVVVAGLPDSYESEAFDREHMRLPDGHIRMIQAVAEANPNTVVVLLGGSAMELPWADKVKAILYMGLPGQAGGQAIADLLTGTANPSGKLAESWPLAYDDVISKDTFGKKNTEYREGIYVGYRYYDKAGKRVRYPFGHGLSYTQFQYSDLTVENRTVSCGVTNAGNVRGCEVVQLYISAPANGLVRPEKELKGFCKVELQPGETKHISFELDDRDFAVWTGGWEIPEGHYTVLIGSSSRDLRLRGELDVEGVILSAPEWQNGSWYETLSGDPTREEWEQLMGYAVPVAADPVKGQFDMNSTCMEMKDTSLIMKLQYKVTERIVAKGFGGKRDLSDPAYRMMLTAATDCPMRSVVISSGGIMSDSLAKGLLYMANGHFVKGLLAMMEK